MSEKAESVPYTTEVYDSSQRPHPIVEEFHALIHYNELILQSISRAIKTRYKRSALGVLWTMLNPLLMMVVLTVVFSQIFRFSVEHYPVYILCGIVIWNFYSGSTSGAMGEMLWSGELLTRIYVPKSIFTVSSIGTGLLNLLLSLIPLFLISIALGVPITPALLVTPLAILILTGFALGMGLLLSTITVFFADMLPVYEVILRIWFYATPIIYPLEIVPERLLWLIKLNPMYYMVELFRQPLLNGTVPELNYWLIAAGSALLSLIVGSIVFTSKSNDYAYRL
ncbi:MAG: ABC transporter permease [Chloroflexota bacterium]|nr:ABC transporter permease [Chloroflexota bacterium]